MYLTDLGQSPDANVAGITIDGSGNVYMAGTSSSSQFPSLSGSPNIGADFVLQLDASGTKARKLFRFPLGTIGAPPFLNNSGQLLLPSSTGALLTLPPEYAFDTPAIVGIANSASYALNSPIVGGELVSLFGYGLDGSVPNAQVYVANVPATVLYAGPNQINFQVPFETPLYGFIELRVVVPAGSINLKTRPYPSFPPSLGIFTTDGLHAAALNQDGTINSATNPAVGGSVISLFGTGAFWPSGLQDGAVAASAIPLNEILNPFAVMDAIGRPMSILYAGTAPGIIYGVFQINVQIAPNAVPPFTLHNLYAGAASNAVQLYLE